MEYLYIIVLEISYILEYSIFSKFEHSLDQPSSCSLTSTVMFTDLLTNLDFQSWFQFSKFHSIHSGVWNFFKKNQKFWHFEFQSCHFEILLLVFVFSVILAGTTFARFFSSYLKFLLTQIYDIIFVSAHSRCIVSFFHHLSILHQLQGI